MTFEAFLARLKSCLISGTSFSDVGGRVRVKPKPNEVVFFFVIDDNTNSNCLFRQKFKVKGMICDLLVSYSNESNRLLCFVEAKGKNVKHAVRQILNTYRHLRRSLGQSELLQQIGLKAYVYQHGSAPSNTDRTWIKQQLERNFGRGNYRVSRNSDLGSFLRK